MWIKYPYFPFPAARALLSFQSFVVAGESVRADVLLSAEKGDAGRRCVQALRQACVRDGRR